MALNHEVGTAEDNNVDALTRCQAGHLSEKESYIYFIRRSFDLTPLVKSRVFCIATFGPKVPGISRKGSEILRLADSHQ